MLAGCHTDLATQDGALDDSVASVVAELHGVDSVDVKTVELQREDRRLVTHIAVDDVALDAEDTTTHRRHFGQRIWWLVLVAVARFTFAMNTHMNGSIHPQ